MIVLQWTPDEEDAFTKVELEFEPDDDGNWEWSSASITSLAPPDPDGESTAHEDFIDAVSESSPYSTVAEIEETCSSAFEEHLRSEGSPDDDEYWT